jgi:thermostable 8-oxoguanine DNA glycosylase
MVVSQKRGSPLHKGTDYSQFVAKTQEELDDKIEELEEMFSEPKGWRETLLRNIFGINPKEELNK